MIDRNSHNIDLVIRPLLCSDLTNNNGYSCENSSGTKSVTIINKRGGFFFIDISASLIFEDIIFDSLDSIITCIVILFYFLDNPIR